MILPFSQLYILNRKSAARRIEWCQMVANGTQINIYLGGQRNCPKGSVVQAKRPSFSSLTQVDSPTSVLNSLR